MDLFSIMTFAGGLAMFLYGMNVMGESLEKKAGGKLKGVLEKITSNPFWGVILGTVVTALIQSSSATTVMVVGFVNSGIMTLENSIGVIMGANIGTAMTAWLISLTGIESSNFFLQLIKPSTFSPVLAMVGVVITMFSSSESRKDTAKIMIGFAVLMFGMETMSATMKPLADIPEFRNLLLYFNNPVLGVLTGTAVTAIIQSSGACVGILQAMSMTGSITFGMAVPIIMGQNIGTCVTALISCAGANANAKRAAVIHLYFNVLGVILFLTLFYLAEAFVGLPFINDTVGVVDIAVIHTVFKVFNTAVFLPLRGVLLKLAMVTVKDDKVESTFQYLDDRFLSSPAFAVAQCRELATEMATISRDILIDSMKLVENYDEHDAKRVIEVEDEVDKYEDSLGSYLVKLASKSLTVNDSQEVSRLLHGIGDFERISDHAVNIMQSGQEMHQKGIYFSGEAKEDIRTMQAAVSEILTLATKAFMENDEQMAQRVEPLEEVIDNLKVQLKARHIARLQRGECTTLHGFVFSDLITDLERVADHCSNIAVAVIELSHEGFEAHQYLTTLRLSENLLYKELYSSFVKKYELK